MAALKAAMSYGQRHPEADQFGLQGADVAEGLTDDVMRKVGVEMAEEQRERSMARQDSFAERAQVRRGVQTGGDGDEGVPPARWRGCSPRDAEVQRLHAALGYRAHYVKEDMLYRRLRYAAPLAATDVQRHVAAPRTYSRWPKRVVSVSTVRNRFGSWCQTVMLARQAMRLRCVRTSAGCLRTSARSTSRGSGQSLFVGQGQQRLCNLLVQIYPRLEPIYYHFFCVVQREVCVSNGGALKSPGHYGIVKSYVAKGLDEVPARC
jgi:hypothetical protein